MLDKHLDGSSRLTQRAEFEARGVVGRLYWYALPPVHAIMFAGMIRAIRPSWPVRGRPCPGLDKRAPGAEIWAEFSGSLNRARRPYVRPARRTRWPFASGQPT